MMDRKPGIASRIIDLAIDGAALGGAGLIIYGVGLIYHPAGFITAGLFAFGGAWLTARKAT